MFRDKQPQDVPGIMLRYFIPPFGVGLLTAIKLAEMEGFTNGDQMFSFLCLLYIFFSLDRVIHIFSSDFYIFHFMTYADTQYLTGSGRNW